MSLKEYKNIFLQTGGKLKQLSGYYTFKMSWQYIMNVYLSQESIITAVLFPKGLFYLHKYTRKIPTKYFLQPPCRENPEALLLLSHRSAQKLGFSQISQIFSILPLRTYGFQNQSTNFMITTWGFLDWQANQIQMHFNSDCSQQQGK